MSEWIKLEDERPEPYRRVLMALENRIVIVAEIHEGGLYSFDDPEFYKDSRATHWMPLAKAPEVKE